MHSVYYHCYWCCYNNNKEEEEEEEEEEKEKGEEEEEDEDRDEDEELPWIVEETTNQTETQQIKWNQLFGFLVFGDREKLSTQEKNRPHLWKERALTTVPILLTETKMQP